MPVFTTRDRVEAVLQAIRDLTGHQLLVGIPDSNAGRKPVAGMGPITNAAIAYIQENGSPAKHIPARPFLRPGVAAVAQRAAAIMGRGATKAANGEPRAGINAMMAAGLVAQNSVRLTLTRGVGYAPLSLRTLQARAARGRKGAKREIASRAAGNAPNAANARPLVDTGQLRAAVTFVIRRA